jgi:hypothetical protein
LGQTLPAPPPQAPGEVISVRPADPSARGWKIEVPDGGRFVGTNVPLVNYVMFAYHVREDHGTAALKEQLGLELKPGRGRRRYLVVDHIESLKP